MIPRGAEQLIAMRLEGWRPSKDVWITYGDFREPGRSVERTKPVVFTDWSKWDVSSDSPELLIRPEDSIERIDLRCVAGLGVVLFFVEWSEKVARLEERLREYAAEITVMSPSFDDDIGWWWRRGIGQTDIDGKEAA